MALYLILASKDFAKNIISGSKSSGLFPFDPDEVNYEKCVVKSNNNSLSLRNEHDDDILFKEASTTEFKNAYQNNPEWQRNVAFQELYKVWRKIQNDGISVSQPLTLYSDLNNLTVLDFPEWNDNVAFMTNSEAEAAIPKINILQDITVVLGNNPVESNIPTETTVTVASLNEDNSKPDFDWSPH
ncbi:hypothetical protein ILUMI_14869 [Ignelater luminosus]|uniref:Uncharacterized protein n=1 Tax=Ignelater luminosus TaxID=2038154 RepID=A0A8K0CRM0_IGNLU|nr:hypothetical protein ILUMI_14869 [Ignelater luminosus]